MSNLIISISICSPEYQEAIALATPLEDAFELSHVAPATEDNMISFVRSLLTVARDAGMMAGDVRLFAGLIAEN